MDRDSLALIRYTLQATLQQSDAFTAVSVASHEPFQLWAVTTEGNELSVNLVNLYGDVRRATPDDRERLLADFATSMVDSARLVDSGTPVPVLDQLVALIKSAAWLDRASAVAVPRRHLVADLNVVYAFDRPNVTSYASAAQLERLAVPLDRIHEIAINNLRSRLPREIPTRGDGKSFLLMVGGNYEASLVLVDEVWERLAASVLGDAIVCVLARDLCLVTGSRTPGGIESLRRAKDRMFAGGPPSYFISTTLIRRHDSQWVEYRES